MSNTRKPKSIKDRLAAAKLPERSVQVCLRGDLAAEFDEVERQLQSATNSLREGKPERASGSERIRLAKRLEDIRTAMSEEMLSVKVRALPRHRWQEIAAKHPPRDDHDGDQALGVNFEEFMAEVMPLSIVDPEMDAEDWTQLNEVLSAGDFDTLAGAVWAVNRRGVDVPKSRLASLVMAEHDAASKRLEPGE